MANKSKKQRVRNYFVVMLPTNVGIITSVVGTESELREIQENKRLKHVAVEDRSVRVHLFHEFATMDSFEVISSCGTASEIIHEVMNTEIMPVYCEITIE